MKVAEYIEDVNEFTCDDRPYLNAPPDIQSLQVCQRMMIIAPCGVRARSVVVKDRCHTICLEKFDDAAGVAQSARMKSDT